MTYPDPAMQQAKEAKDFQGMRTEILQMQQSCEQLHSPVVFTHNDLLSGNVMVPLEVSIAKQLFRRLLNQLLLLLAPSSMPWSAAFIRQSRSMLFRHLIPAFNAHCDAQ